MVQTSFFSQSQFCPTLIFSHSDNELYTKVYCAAYNYNHVAMPFWLVSLPLASKRKDAAWELLQERTTGLSHNSKLDVPDLRVGTLDTLMQLSDDLAKTNNFIEVVVTKLRRQVQDLGGPLATTQLRVKGLSAEAYLTRFKWNEAKFQAKRPLKEIVEIITESVSKIEDDLKVIDRIILMLMFGWMIPTHRILMLFPNSFDLDHR